MNSVAAPTLITKPATCDFSYCICDSQPKAKHVCVVLQMSNAEPEGCVNGASLSQQLISTAGVLQLAALVLSH